ncbi:MAG: hypothetical protein K2M48_00370 [Clostridiales bacterium]|nr:hypothetical protein [Clostridiales bacterium]
MGYKENENKSVAGENEEYRKRAEEERLRRIERFADILLSDDNADVKATAESDIQDLKDGLDKIVGREDHSGHRERLREKLLRLDDWSGVDVCMPMEGFLSFTVPRVDVDPLARSLLEYHNNSLWSALNADPAELAKFPMMSERTSRVFSHVARLAQDGGRRSTSIASRSDAVEFFSALNAGESGVKTHIAYLDADYDVIEVETLRGESAVSPATIVGAAYKHEARFVIIGRRDSALLPQWFGGAEYAEELRELLDTVGVKLLDIMVFTGLGYYSLGMTAVRKDVAPVYSFVPLVTIPEIGQLMYSATSGDADD